MSNGLALERRGMDTGLAGTGVVDTGIVNTGASQMGAPINYAEVLATQGGFAPDAIAQMNPMEQLQAYNAMGLGKDTEGVLGTGMSGMDMGRVGLGVGQLGLGLASYLDQSKTNKMNRNLMQQQYDTNVESLANKRTADANLMKAFRG